MLSSDNRSLCSSRHRPEHPSCGLRRLQEPHEAGARLDRVTARSRLARVLLTLRLRFAGGPDYELAVEAPERDLSPRELLLAQADENGRISLGDRESCRIDEIIEVELVQPTQVEGPTFERGLQDEDVATALEENYEHP